MRIEEKIIEAVGEKRFSLLTAGDIAMIRYSVEEHEESIEQALIRVLFRRIETGNPECVKSARRNVNTLPSCYKMASSSFATVTVVKDGKTYKSLTSACRAYGLTGQESLVKDLHDRKKVTYQYIFDHWDAVTKCISVKTA